MKKYLIWLLVAAVLFAAGYFGYSWWSGRKAKAAAEKEAKSTAANNPAPAANNPAAAPSGSTPKPGTAKEIPYLQRKICELLGLSPMNFDIHKPIVKGMPKCNEVKVLQAALNKAYKLSLSVDGSYGPKTDSEVKMRFQTSGLSLNAYAQKLSAQGKDVFDIKGLDNGVNMPIDTTDYAKPKA